MSYLVPFKIPLMGRLERPRRRKRAARNRCHLNRSYTLPVKSRLLRNDFGLGEKGLVGLFVAQPRVGFPLVPLVYFPNICK